MKVERGLEEEEEEEGYTVVTVPRMIPVPVGSGLVVLAYVGRMGGDVLVLRLVVVLPHAYTVVVTTLAEAVVPLIAVQKESKIWV